MIGYDLSSLHRVIVDNNKGTTSILSKIFLHLFTYRSSSDRSGRIVNRTKAFVTPMSLNIYEIGSIFTIMLKHITYTSISQSNTVVRIQTNVGIAAKNKSSKRTHFHNISLKVVIIKYNLTLNR